MTLVSRKSVTLVAAVLALLPALADAHEFKIGDLELIHPWTRATPGGAQVAGGYMTIINHGTTADQLVGGSMVGTTAAQLHQMSMDGGVMKMRPIGPLVIPPGQSVALSPSGDHMMFTGLGHGLKRGQMIDGTLVFEHAGTVQVRFAVESMGAKAPMGAPKTDHPDHPMPGMTD